MLSLNEMNELVGEDVLKYDENRIETHVSTPFEHYQFDLLDDDFLKR